MGDSPDIELKGVTKRSGAVRALDGIDLAVPRGAFLTFLGPSGCGKTTALRLISGFEQPTGGEVRIAGRSVVGVPAYRRPVNMVFLHCALFPHLLHPLLAAVRPGGPEAAPKLALGLGSLIAAHSLFTMAPVVLIVRARLAGMDRSLVEASMDLYATPWATFPQVTLPQLVPAILAGFLLAFTFSFDDFVVARPEWRSRGRTAPPRPASREAGDVPGTWQRSADGPRHGLSPRSRHRGPWPRPRAGWQR